MSFRDCVVCDDGIHVEHYCEMDVYEYVRCKQCGLIYVDQLEKTENIYQAYSGGNLKSLRRRLMAPFRKHHHDRNYKSSVARAKAIFSFSADQVSSISGKYLDIGCNKGYLLAQGLAVGWDVYGCELVPELTTPFLNSYNECQGNVHQGRFADLYSMFDKNSFDLVTAIDVIEHFEDVIMDLKNIYAILKPGAVLVIQTPDVDSPQAKQLVAEWGALKPLEHIHLFNYSNLEILAKHIGFSSVKGVEQAFEVSDGNFVAVLSK